MLYSHLSPKATKPEKTSGNFTFDATKKEDTDAAKKEDSSPPAAAEKRKREQDRMDQSTGGSLGSSLEPKPFDRWTTEWGSGSAAATALASIMTVVLQILPGLTTALAAVKKGAEYLLVVLKGTTIGSGGRLQADHLKH